MSLFGKLFSKSPEAQAQQLLRSERDFDPLGAGVEKLTSLGPEVINVLKQFTDQKYGSSYGEDTGREYSDYQRRALGAAVALSILDQQDGPWHMARSAERHLDQTRPRRWSKSPPADPTILMEAIQVLATKAEPGLAKRFAEVAIESDAKGDDVASAGAIRLLPAFGSDQALDGLQAALMAGLEKEKPRAIATHGLLLRSLKQLTNMQDPRVAQVFGQAVSEYPGPHRDEFYQALAAHPTPEAVGALCNLLDDELVEQFKGHIYWWTSGAVHTSRRLVKALGSCAVLGTEEEKAMAAGRLVRCLAIPDPDMRDDVIRFIPMLGSSALTHLERAIADPPGTWFGERWEVLKEEFSPTGWVMTIKDKERQPTTLELANTLIEQIRQ